MAGNLERIQELFEEARHLSEEERCDFLDSACADAAEREVVEDLIDSFDAGQGDLFDRPLFEVPPVPAESQAPERIGRFRIVRPIGEGSMGLVYEARQDRPDRRVAIKVLRHADLSGQLARRFEREAEVLALLQDPRIAHVYEIGVHAGAPWFAMEYVDGLRLDHWVQRHALGVEERILLVAEVCDAVHAAHQKGVVHRDLKPGNVMVDRGGRPKVLDFGMAKVTRSDIALSMQTATGQIVGSLAYMSPEQARGEVQEIDIRSDVYSLGVILYEVLSGQHPIDVHEASVLEAIQRVCRRPPRRLGTLDRSLGGDLETVAETALAKEPGRRYASASELSADLRRVLARLPIQARPVGRAEQLWLWCRRNPVTSVLVCALWLSMSLGLVAVIAKMKEAQRERDESLKYQASITFRNGRDLARRGDVSHGLMWMAESLGVAPPAEEALRRTVRVNLAAWSDWVPGRSVAFRDLSGTVSAVALEPGGPRVAIGTVEGAVRLLDRGTGQARGSPVEVDGRVVALAIDPGATRLAAAVLPADRRRPDRVLLFDLDSMERLGDALSYPTRVRDLAFGPNGDRLHLVADGAGDSSDGSLLHSVDVAAHRPLDPAIPIAPTERIGVSGDGRWLLALDRESGRLVDAGSLRPEGAPLELEEGDRVEAFDPGGRGVWASRHDFAYGRSTLRLLPFDSPGSPDRVLRLPALVHPRGRVQLTPDGRTVTFMASDLTVWTWDAVRDCAFGPPLPGYLRYNEWHLLGPDGRSLVTRDWLTELPRPLSRAVPSAELVVRPTISGFDHKRQLAAPGLRTEVVYDERRTIALTARRFPGAEPDALYRRAARLWDLESGQPIRRPLRHAANALTIAMNRDGTLVATSGNAPGSLVATTRVWDVASGEPVASPFEHTNSVSSLAFSPDGTRIAAGDYNGQVRLWDPWTAEPFGPPLIHSEIVIRVAFSPDGELLAAGTSSDYTRSPHLRLWRVVDHQPLWAPQPHDEAVEHVEFSPDGGALATGTQRHVRLFRVATGELVGEPIPTRWRAAVAFSVDGRTLAVGDFDGSIRLFDTASGRPAGSAFELDRPIHDLDFGPAGAMIVAGTEDGSAHLVGVEAREPLGPPVAQGGPIHAVAFRPDGRSFVSTTRDGESRVWPVPSPVGGDPEVLASTLELRTGLRARASRAVDDLSPQDWSELESEMGASGGPIALGRPIDDVEWHEARARDAEQDGDAFAVGWHLDRRIALGGAPWITRARLARALASDGRFEEADRELAAAEEVAPGDELFDWSLHGAVEAFEDGAPPLAEWFLDRRIARRPGDAALLADRSVVRSARGDDEGARADLDAALELDPEPWLLFGVFARAEERGDLEEAADLSARLANRFAELDQAVRSIRCWRRVASIRLSRGDLDGYRETCRLAVERWGGSAARPEVASNLIWLCVLGPGAIDRPERLVEWAERLTSSLPDDVAGPTRHARSRVAGAALLRAGRSGAAVERLEAGLRATVGDGSVYDWVFLEAALRGAGRASEAESYRERLDAYLANEPSDFEWGRLEIELLAAELGAAGGS